jgi:hypothetical protein
MGREIATYGSTPFQEHLDDTDAVIERLLPFDIVCVMRERTPRAAYFLVQQLLPVMCKGSSVVLLSSLAAFQAFIPMLEVNCKAIPALFSCQSRLR